MLNIVVGEVVDVQPHPSADSLYVEKIDLGEVQAASCRLFLFGCLVGVLYCYHSEREGMVFEVG